MEKQELFAPPPVGVGNKGARKIVVIGGGVTGVLCAFEMARAGHEVILVEMGSLGSGSSGRSAACIRQQFSTPSTVRGMVYSTKFFQSWCSITGMEENPIKQNGYIFCYDRRSDCHAIEQRVIMQKRAGLNEVEFLTRAQIEEQFPYIQTVGLVCATWCKTDGFLRPHVIYQDGAEAAKLLGVRIVSGAEITGAVFDIIPSRRIKAVRTTQGDLEADLVVNATNAWACQVSQRLGGIALPIYARKRYLYFTLGPSDQAQVEEFKNRPMIISPDGAYCRPEPSGKLMMGWVHHAPAVNSEIEDQDTIQQGFGIHDPYDYGRAVHSEISRFVPDVSVQRVNAATCGFYAETPDHNPVIDFDPWIGNLIHAAGFSGHGLMHAPFTARIVAELVAANMSVCDMDLPLGLGSVDLDPYFAMRKFLSHESMQI